MLSPNDIDRKAATPSIWSYDSGYGSTSVCEEQGALLQLVRLIFRLGFDHWLMALRPNRKKVPQPAHTSFPKSHVRSTRA